MSTHAGPKRNFSTQIPATLQERVRATVTAMQRLAGASYTLSQFVADALLAHVQHLEAKHNDGKPWPASPPEGTLTRGRRLENSTETAATTSSPSRRKQAT